MFCWSRQAWHAWPVPAFGAYGEGYLRFSIANSMENLDKALDKINTWAKKNL